MPRPRKLATALSAAVLGLLAAAGGAAADSSVSSNWSGYVAHRAGVSFRQVTGTWRQPADDCTQTSPGYAAAWVGLGGYSETSQALEQIGTEADCASTGRMEASAWYELVPAPSEPIRMTVRGGDLMRATVRVVRGAARLSLADLTSHASFSRVFRVSPVDVSSADWIVEAPSECSSNNNCRTLPLADFQQIRWSGARALTVAGASGPITSDLWGTTSISLAPDGRTYYASLQSQAASAAIPSALRASGAGFTVNWQQTQTAPASGGPWGSANRAAGNASLQPGGRRTGG